MIFLYVKLKQEFIVQLKYTRRMITMIRDQTWKDIRSSITPAFTSGKIKRVSSTFLRV